MKSGAERAQHVEDGDLEAFKWREGVAGDAVKGIGISLLALALTSCADRPVDAPAQKPQQAGQPLDPLATAARIAAIRGAAVLSDQEAVQAQMGAFQEDFRKAIKLADPGQRVDQESARTAARSIADVRSVVWLDHENLFAIVGSNASRSYETIDGICLALEPLGDTLGVVVNLQSAAARSGDELEILSRNCQLAPGDRAMLQRNRQVDLVAPEIRAQHKANQEWARAQRDRSAEQVESMRVLEASTPEM